MLSFPRFATALLAGLLSAAPALAEIKVHDAFVRATPPGANVSEAFMRLENDSGESATLIGASADKAPEVELNTSSGQDGIEIKAHSDHRLQADGDYLTLKDLPKPLVEGESVELTLQFSYGGEPVKVSVPVLSPESEMELEMQIYRN